MSKTPQFNLDPASPPEGHGEAYKALWWLKKGGLTIGPQWEQAHMICQSGEGQLAFDLIHALAHRIEGDLGNADYWSARAGEAQSSSSIAEEWQSLVARFASGSTQ